MAAFRNIHSSYSPTKTRGKQNSSSKPITHSLPVQGQSDNRRNLQSQGGARQRIQVSQHSYLCPQTYNPRKSNAQRDPRNEANAFPPLPTTIKQHSGKLKMQNTHSLEDFSKTPKQTAKKQDPGTVAGNSSVVLENQIIKQTLELQSKQTTGPNKGPRPQVAPEYRQHSKHASMPISQQDYFQVQRLVGQGDDKRGKQQAPQFEGKGADSGFKINIVNVHNEFNIQNNIII